MAITTRDRIRLRLLGRITLTLDSNPTAPIRISTRKAGALIAYLAMRPDQTARREELAGLLWGECSESQARQSLRQALAILRKELTWAEFLVTDNDIIALRPGAWSVDAREFEELTKSTHSQDLDQAARLFQGEFLSGYDSIDEEGFAEWLREQRHRSHLAAGRLCETFALRPELVQDSEQAIAAVERLLVLDPLRENYQRIALTLYARYRGKAEALTRAQAFTEMLQRELSVAPEKETRLLVERIRADGIPLLKPADPATVPETSTTVAIPPGSTLTQSPMPQEPSEKRIASAASPSPAANRPWIRREFAAGLVLATVALLGGILGTMYLRGPSIQGTLAPTNGDASRLTRFWESPRPPSGSTPATFGEARRDIIPIVVLPFKTFGNTTGSTELVADMMTDDLIYLLSRVSFIRVISRQTAQTFRGQPIDVAAIGAELNVKYVLEGSVRTIGDQLRVNVELIDPSTRLAVWSGRIEHPTANNNNGTNAVLDEIVARLSRELQFEIIPIESAHRSNDSNVAALIYRGWAALTRVNLNDYKQAHAYFQMALERDPQNLSAQIGMGAYHARMGAQVFDNQKEAHRKKAEEILRDAVRRDPESSVAYFYLGLALNLLPTLPEAIDYFERSVELDPSNASAYGQMGNALIRTHRPAEGLEHVNYAMRLSPRDPIISVWLEFAGNAELELHHFPEAIENFRRATAINPGYPRGWAGLAAAHALAGHNAQAHEYAEKLRTFQPTLSTPALIKLFGRHEESVLHEGLALAFGQTTENSPVP